MKTVLWILGGLFLFSRLHNQGVSANVTVGAGTTGLGFGGAAPGILEGQDPYAGLSLIGGEGGFGPGAAQTVDGASGSGSSSSGGSGSGSGGSGGGSSSGGGSGVSTSTSIAPSGRSSIPTGFQSAGTQNPLNPVGQTGVTPVAPTPTPQPGGLSPIRGGVKTA